MNLKIDDLPFAEANAVAFFVAFTPTSDIVPTMTETVVSVPTSNVPTPMPPYIPPTQPVSNQRKPNTTIPLVVLVLLLLAFIVAPQTRGKGGQSE